jgi:small redox-active disulfide protein 2
MKILVLGTGCPKCKKLYEHVEEALKSLNMEAELGKVTDISEIIEYGVMSTPALVIDDEVVVSGKVPDVSELIKILKGE